MKFKPKKHYKIAERITVYGKFELWEHEFYGDEVPCIVTLDGEILTKTWDDLDTAIKEYMEA